MPQEASQMHLWDQRGDLATACAALELPMQGLSGATRILMPVWPLL